MNLDRRIWTLERRRGAASPAARCGECGMDASVPLSQQTFRTEFRPMGQHPDGFDRCATCGRTLVYRVEFDKAG